MGQRSSGDSQTPRVAGIVAAQPHLEAAGEAGGLNLDPVIMALLRNIPRTGDGWPALARVRWMRTFAMAVSQIYDAGTEPVELRIECEDIESDQS
jgi:hypothetical protein